MVLVSLAAFPAAGGFFAKNSRYSVACQKAGPVFRFAGGGRGGNVVGVCLLLSHHHHGDYFDTRSRNSNPIRGNWPHVLAVAGPSSTILFFANRPVTRDGGVSRAAVVFEILLTSVRIRAMKFQVNLSPHGKGRSHRHLRSV